MSNALDYLHKQGYSLKEVKEMARGIDNIKVQLTQRTDGRITVTLKLIGWQPERINAIIYHMVESRSRVVGRIGNEIRSKLLTTFSNYDKVGTEHETE